MTNIVGNEDYVLTKDDNNNEIILFHPYNPINIAMNKEELRNILCEYVPNFEIHEFEFYVRAFVDESYTKQFLEKYDESKVILAECPANCLDVFPISNQCLEFLGDGVLECCTKIALYLRFDLKKMNYNQRKLNEGFLTNAKIALVNNEALGKIIQKMGLQKYWIISRENESKKIRNNLQKLGCLFESFIGAIFLDEYEFRGGSTGEVSGNAYGVAMEKVNAFITKVYEKHIDWTEKLTEGIGCKNKLQVIFQKEFNVVPKYVEIEKYSETKGYNVGVFLCVQPNITIQYQHSLPIGNFKSLQHLHQSFAENPNQVIYLTNGVNKNKKKAQKMCAEKGVELYEKLFSS
jgi:dsRNA-specific ribonuclease